jgi:hypothetical protein
MSVRINGLTRLLADLERRLGQERIQAISDEALRAGAEEFVRELIIQFESFKDKGYSIEEITISGPITVSGVRTMKIHWRGPHDRYRIIHLNEWGTVQNPNPDGKGAIARALRNSENAYKRAVEDAIRRGI